MADARLQYIPQGVFAAVQRLDTRLGFHADNVYGAALTGFAARLDDAQRAALAADPDVLSIEPDGIASAIAQTLPWGIDRVNADASSTLAGNGSGAVSGVHAYVIDTGSDAGHTDLSVASFINFAGAAPSASDDARGTRGSRAASEPTQDLRALGARGPRNRRGGAAGAGPAHGARLALDRGMTSMSRSERQLKRFMQASAVTYLVVGFAFALAPNWILGLFNQIAHALPLAGLEDIPPSTEKFWLSLSFSMMMTIATIAFVVQHNVRKNKTYTVPLLVAKLASSVSSLAFFLVSARYFAYLVTFLVDGALFWMTLFFYARASAEYLRVQTGFLREESPIPLITRPTKVVVETGDDKLAMLDAILDETGFFELLERRRAETGKSKEAFSVVIKPNFMFMHSRKDISTYTDPALVEALVDRIVAHGFTNVALVESQSTLGNHYRNREVLKVAEYIGYSTTKSYRIVDLTEERVPYDYGGRLGRHFVGPTWRDADFRISFAKNKTHVFSHYTLTLKNIYGTLPMQNKLKEYHTKREYDWPTIETMRHFPVHFGLIDAIYSADGQFGVMTDPKPNHTRTLIGGESLIAVDWVGAKKMGLDPDDPKVGRFLPLAIEAFGKPERIEWIGDRSVYRPWVNVSEIFIKSLDLIEEAYAFSDWWFAGLSAMDAYFPFKKRSLPLLILRKLLRPIKRIFYRYDYLGPDLAEALHARAHAEARGSGTPAQTHGMQVKLPEPAPTPALAPAPAPEHALPPGPAAESHPLDPLAPIAAAGGRAAPETRP